jgi:hypothetical protein
MESYASMLQHYKIEEKDDWRGWLHKIPFIPVKPGWLIQPCPPFSGAVARFRVKLPDGRVKSVYFDGYDRLGFMNAPYWEVYPVEGDCGRCMQDEVDKLIELIEAPDDEAKRPSDILQPDAEHK